MLQKAFRTVVAEALVNANSSVTVKVGSSDAAPTDADNGLKGTELASATLEVDQDNQAFLAKVASLLIPSGEAKEMVFINQDGVVMDRLLITPIAGGPNGVIAVEYRLECLS